MGSAQDHKSNVKRFDHVPASRLRGGDALLHSIQVLAGGRGEICSARSVCQESANVGASRRNFTSAAVGEVEDF
jgi:hypothetical protein